ncbi:MAG: hypothetical protein MUE46_04635 [Xanthomonadales bacterium]|jgi:hypothetical protein|nr:hypothetical protein [Xanthomonadales bacterium]
MWDASQGAGLSSLPSRRTLACFHGLGVRYGVNVSGASSAEIYGDELPPGLVCHDFRFADVFTRREDAAAAWIELGEAGRTALTAAVRCTAEALAAAVPVLVFCHLGVGRSPLVLAMALEQARGMSRAQAMATVKALRSGAAFSPAALGVWDRLQAVEAGA